MILICHIKQLEYMNLLFENFMVNKKGQLTLGISPSELNITFRVTLSIKCPWRRSQVQSQKFTFFFLSFLLFPSFHLSFHPSFSPCFFPHTFPFLFLSVSSFLSCSILFPFTVHPPFYLNFSLFLIPYFFCF